MKKSLIIGILAAVALLVVGGVGVAFAQSTNPDVPQNPYGYGSMGSGAYGRGGMMGGWGAGMDWDGEDGPMHEYMVDAIAEVFGLTPEEVEALHDEGLTLWDWAQEQGLSFEEFQAKMLEAKEIALSAAVADGVITQEQADWMLDHMFGMWGAGGGFGPCHGNDGFGGRGRGSGSRWNTQPSGPEA